MATPPPPPRITILLLFANMLFPSMLATDTLLANQPMISNQSLVSAASNFKLGFFFPGDPKRRYLAIWYNKIPLLTAVWVANRQSALPESGGSLMLHNNGTLALTDRRGVVHWTTGTAGATDGVPTATLLDFGNLVVKNGKGSVIWQSFDYPTDTILPGMKLGRDLLRGLDLGCTAWIGDGDPAPGPYRMFFDVHGVPEVFLYFNWTKKWRSGPWNGKRFSGVPEMTTYGMFSFEYFANKEEISYIYHITDSSVISRLFVNPDGVAQRVIWIDRTSSWNPIWWAPKDQCDSVSPCGPFGICDPNASPVCNCLRGFKPRSPQEWHLRDGTDGCVRETLLDCRNGTDGFLVVGGAKLPDTTNATVDYKMSLGDCHAACLSNCTCTAYAAANNSGGASGCIIWAGELSDLRVYTSGGQDLFVRLASKDLDFKSSSMHRKKVLIAVTVCVVVSIILIGLCGVLLRKKKRKTSADRGSITLGTSMSVNKYHTQEGSIGREMELTLFEFGTIAAATNCFSMMNKLGEGGFGLVYKGKLEDGQEVAVKRLGRNSVQGMDEFKNEVMLIANLQHRNLVRLLGCCVDGEERMLIYEYMPNTSLDAFLFDKAKGYLLDWQTRYRIIEGIARGLLYLHQDSRFRIIHRDLKASNILLDEEMNPKISDFGMARIFGGDETEANTRRVVGTYGYMSPEYAMDGLFSVKSDVYSFGVLVLEIISGERNRGIYRSEPLKNLVGHTWNLWKEGRTLEIVDKTLQHQLPSSEVLKCVHLGLLCVQERPEDRPTMTSLVLMMGSDSVSLPRPRPPGFITMRGPMDMYLSSGMQESCSTYDITVTASFEGR